MMKDLSRFIRTKCLRYTDSDFDRIDQYSWREDVKRIENIPGVPDYESHEYEDRKKDYCLLIPIINEGERIRRELERAVRFEVSDRVDIIICDGDSTDGSTDEEKLRSLGVNTLLIKKGPGKQGAQLRMGIHFALNRGYRGILTIDGNNKDSIEHVGRFIEKLEEGYDYVQGSRFIEGGHAVRTPIVRNISVRLIHAPIISLTAHKRFTDTTNNFRAYSRRYLEHEQVKPLRDIFSTYELLAYLSSRATQIGLKACEVPVDRVYPRSGKTPTKISAVKGNANLMGILLKNAAGRYDP